MRILFCNYEYPPLGGGGGVVNALLAQELATRHDVTILTSGGLGLPTDSVENGVRVVRVPSFFRKEKAVANMPSMLAYVLMATQVGKRLLSVGQYDIINTHFALPTGPVGQTLANFAGIPNILSVHGGDLYDPSKFTSPHRHFLLRLWVKRLLRSATFVVGQSTNTLGNMRRFYTPEIDGVRIPLGIQKPQAIAASRKQYGFQEDEVLLVTAGRLVSRKAVGQLLNAMEHLRGTRTHLLIIGTGPQEQLLKQQVLEKNLNKTVHFLGYVHEAEKFQLLKMCDLFVSTSQHEGFGLVFLEAMASGLPVVCYDHGGQRDFLENGKTGFLIPLNDLETFTYCCEVLIQNRPKCRQIGIENLQRAEALFIDSCANHYEAIFTQAIETQLIKKRRVIPRKKVHRLLGASQ